MKVDSTIRKILALLMLVLFTYSIMPKIYLHDLLADHHDSYGNLGGDTPGFYQESYQCDCLDLVVSSPFLEIEAHPEIVNGFTFNLTAQVNYSFNFSSFITIKDSRGPPNFA